MRAVRPVFVEAARQRRDDSRMRLIDVKHLGRKRVIGCWELDGVLIDPGPASSLGTLLEALAEPPRAVLLTHIHLDHAGGAGTLVRRWPGLPIYVHELGAPHLADPSKLIASAARLYGEEMDRLWGEIVPVPQENLRPLAGGEEILGFRVAYTPGHASHHVSYLHGESGTAFVAEEFRRALIADVEREVGGEAARAMAQAVPAEQQWAGLDRYWRQRA